MRVRGRVGRRGVRATRPYGVDVYKRQVLGRIARSMEGDGAGAADAVGADIAAAGPVDALVGASGAAACVQVGV